MEDIKLKLLSLCAFNIKENPLIKAFISTDEGTPDDKIKEIGRASCRERV